MIDTCVAADVCYCAGVGKGISFEQGLAKIATKPIVVLDPTPTATPTIARTELGNLEFFAVGLAAHDGMVEFSVPQDPDEGSFSVPREGLQRMSFECRSLSTIMRQKSDRAIDLLKMDIEGFEYDIIEQILAKQLPVRQLCVEFHDWLRPGQTLKTIWRLHQSGYELIFKHRGDHTFLMKEARYKALLDRKPAVDRTPPLSSIA